MNEVHDHLSPEQAAAYLARQLPPAARLAVSDHLAACADCRALVTAGREPAEQTARVFADLVAAAREAGGSESDEAWRFDAALPPRTAQELMELQEFEATMAAFEPEEFAPGGTLREAAAANTVPRRGERSEPGSWWAWLTMPWAVGLAAAVVAAAVFLSRGMPGPGGRGAGHAAELVDGSLTVRADGGLDGGLSLPAGLRDAVLETVRRRTAPGALLGTVTRGESNAPKPAAPPTAAVEFAPENPVGVIESDRPTFRWQPGTHGGNVEVVIYGSDGEKTRGSGVLLPMSRQWTPPTPLPRGQIYRWQVGPVAALADAPKAKFKVLSAGSHAQLEALRGGPAGRSHLALGVAYAREGMHAEAREEFQQLESANAQSPLARQLLESAETWQ